MYTITNHDEIYVEYIDPYWPHKHKLQILKNEKQLIAFIARGYTDTFHRLHREWFLSLYSLKSNYNDRFKYKYIDGYGRIIDPYIYKKDAWLYYCKYLKNSASNGCNHKKRVKNRPYSGEFRRTPVPGTGKCKGGPYSKRPRTKRIAAMYGNPEFKKYNRGCKQNYSCFNCWESPHRCNERNWKSQRKHQWKEK